MANTLYVAVYTSAATATWARGDLGNGRDGWSASGYVAKVTDGAIISADGDEVGSLGSVLTAGTSYKIWAIVDDGSTSSNSGTPQASAAFVTTPTLTVADATHAHAADNLALTLDTTLVIVEASHSHVADNLALSTEVLLTVEDATHAHAADAPTLSATELLAIADATHGHSADNVTLSLTGSEDLVVADATHAHTADAPTLVTDSLLAIADALHGHAADNVVLVVPSTGDVQAIWSHILPNGVTAEVALSTVYDWLNELHLIHGLRSGSPLTVSTTERAAGGISQTLGESGGTTTVTRH